MCVDEEISLADQELQIKIAREQSNDPDFEDPPVRHDFKRIQAKWPLRSRAHHGDRMARSGIGLRNSQGVDLVVGRDGNLVDHET
jgi:hypothetical protein